jgi:hypothetical protein
MVSPMPASFTLIIENLTKINAVCWRSVVGKAGQDHTNFWQRRKQGLALAFKIG